MGSADIVVGVEQLNKYGMWRAVPPPGQPLDKPGKIDWTAWDFGCCPESMAVLGESLADEPFKPISEPRGLPKDRERRGEFYGEYDQSWLLLSEILAYDWDEPVIVRGRYSEEFLVTPRESCSGLWRFIRRVQQALPGEDPARVRIIFGFY